MKPNTAVNWTQRETVDGPTCNRRLMTDYNVVLFLHSPFETEIKRNVSTGEEVAV